MLMICRYILLDAEHASRKITVAQRPCKAGRRVTVYQVLELPGAQQFLQESIVLLAAGAISFPR